MRDQFLIFNSIENLTKTYIFFNAIIRLIKKVINLFSFEIQISLKNRFGLKWVDFVLLIYIKSEGEVY